MKTGRRGSRRGRGVASCAQLLLAVLLGTGCQPNAAERAATDHWLQCTDCGMPTLDSLVNETLGGQGGLRAWAVVDLLGYALREMPDSVAAPVARSLASAFTEVAYHQGIPVDSVALAQFLDVRVGDAQRARRWRAAVALGWLSRAGSTRARGHLGQARFWLSSYPPSVQWVIEQGFATPDSLALYLTSP